MIAFVWAESQNGVIGAQGGLPWKMPADMHHFKTTTINHHILAGRTTYQSFGRPLPKRVNMVLTSHSKSEFPPEVLVFNGLAQFVDAYQHANNDVYVVGGAKVFADLMPMVDVLYRTVIEADINGDTTMPTVDYSQFELVDQQRYPADDRNQYPYTFETYRKK
ncbi:dihydrofolate reductase [Lactobacillaceae bacterium Scapto_B20]